MRRLVQLLLSPPSRFARLLIAEKRLACDLAAPEDLFAHLPLLVDQDGTRCEGLWAIVDHLEGTYPDNALRLLDWAMGPFQEAVTRKIVFEKASQRFTGTPIHRAPDMQIVRNGREALGSALTMLGRLGEQNGYLACRDCTLGDLAVAAHISAIDYFGEVPWADYPIAAEWYVKMKSRPSFRTLLADRVPGQPPVSHYAELDA